MESASEAQRAATADKKSLRDVRIEEKNLERVQALYDQGLCRSAFDLATTFGPLPLWRGTAARVLAGRLAHNLGAPRLGRALHALAYREERDGLLTRAYFAAGVLERYGPWSAWQTLDRFGDPPVPKTASDRDAATYLLSLRARIAATWRDFDTADQWLRRAEEIEKSAWLITERAFLLEQQDRYEAALEMARRSLEQRLASTHRRRR